MSFTVVPTTMFSEVLLATDFSKESDRALTYAKSIVRGSEGKLLLLHVSQLALPLAAEEGVWRDGSVMLEVDGRQAEEAASVLRTQGINARSLVSIGAIGRRVAKTAKATHADLVVIGTHARMGLNRLLHGSYAEEIAGMLDIPLFIVGPNVPEAALRVWNPERILCSTSMKGEEARLVAFACELAAKYRADLEIVSASRVSEKINDAWHFFSESVRDLLPLENANLPLKITPLPAPNAEGLVELAIACNAGLLVLDAKHAEWITAHPRTLQQLLADIPCPVITFPPIHYG